MGKVFFRDLPGIAHIESQLEIEEKLMKDELEALEKAIEETSLRLFGIVRHQTSYYWLNEEDRPATQEEWEKHFEIIEWEFDEEQTFWDAVGIDVTDLDGDQLLCMDVFGRQLICAVKRIHPEARLSFIPGEKSEAQYEADAQAWLKNLLNR